jgi:hypothetical protein
MFKQIKKLLGLLAVPALLLVGTLALAGNTGSVDSFATAAAVEYKSPLTSVTAGADGFTAEKTKALISNVTNIVAFIAISAAVIFIIIGAFQWLSGNEKDGKTNVRNAVIGLVIILLAYVIVQLLAQFIGGLTGSTAKDDSSKLLQTGGN